MWLDITVPRSPVLVWQDGDRRDPDRVKDKDRLPLVEIVDIRAGRASDVLEKSGKSAHADVYMVFAAEGRTLDIEAPTPEGRDWLFRRFADLFQAYALAQREGLVGDRITLRVMKLMDAGVPVKPQAAAAASATPSSVARVPHVGMGAPPPFGSPAGAVPVRGGGSYVAGSPHPGYRGGMPPPPPPPASAGVPPYLPPPAPTPIRMSSLGPVSAFPGASPSAFSGGSGAQFGAR